MPSFVFDTNALIHASKVGVSITSKKHHISIISELELLSYSELTVDDETHLQQMLAQFQIHTITDSIKLETINLRKNKGLKLPDSIILATAQVLGCALITNDKKILNIADGMAIGFDDIVLDKL